MYGGRSMAPKSITRDQLQAIGGEFAAAGWYGARRARGEFVTDALAWYGIEWRHGGLIRWLSEYEAGLVLEAAQERNRPARGPQ
jgi:hypothetical protein